MFSRKIDVTFMRNAHELVHERAVDDTQHGDSLDREPDRRRNHRIAVDLSIRQPCVSPVSGRV